jgi:NNP family nitrate/nitrite transporter-like MFS transporter
MLRLPYTFAVTRIGGGTWTAATTLLLLVPVLMLALCVTHPDTPYGVFLVAAALAGLGGASFASSTSNISFFFPERQKGLALGLNAAGGNLGGSVVQLAVPILVGIGVFGLVGRPQGDGLFLQSAALFWVVDHCRGGLRAAVHGQPGGGAQPFE